MTLPDYDNDQARRVTRYEFMKRALIVFTACVVTVVLGILIVLTVQSSATTQAIRGSQKNNQAVLDTIQDCTQPAGACYKRGQKQTASAVSDINRVIILAAACASSGLPPDLSVAERQAAIQSCVISRLAHHS